MPTSPNPFYSAPQAGSSPHSSSQSQIELQRNSAQLQRIHAISGISVLLNRDIASATFTPPADGWYQVAPLGQHPHPKGPIQVIDSEAIQAMLNRFAEDSKRPNFPGLLVDYEHFSWDPSKESRAAGWIQALQNRDDGLYAQIRWTPAADAAIKSGEYRLISPSFAPTFAPITKQQVRPLRLAGAALTNTPNIQGMVPLSNRQDLPADNKPMDETRKKLGLSAEATDEQIAAAVTALHNRAIAAESRITTLETQLATLADQEAEATLARYGKRIPDAQKPVIKTMLLNNRKDTIALLELLPDPVDTKTVQTGALLNRAQAGVPNTSPATAQDDTAKATARRVKAQAIQAQTKCTWDEAWSAAA